MNFGERLADWYQKNKRELPWRNTKNPYLIWLSEIILQQTRVNQGLDYYLKFAERFPNVKTLAYATQDEVFKLWQGLGYYNRAENMLSTAKLIVDEYGSQFPHDPDLLLKLPGIGPYTSAAIASIAFDIPVPVVDGNVYRVLARIFGIDTPINTTKGAKLFNKHALVVREFSFQEECADILRAAQGPSAGFIKGLRELAQDDGVSNIGIALE